MITFSNQSYSTLHVPYMLYTRDTKVEMKSHVFYFLRGEEGSDLLLFYNQTLLEDELASFHAIFFPLQ